ncbi:MAG: hypothetical protein E4H40_00730 [Candidatus Brocadiia bacterium]|nr:MAG: hypothetical protein E4H40_00730 [Candidatus Brocadiia bacterium]
MKAEHRHELKSNDLALWIANFPNWAKENKNYIIYAGVVVILTFAAWLWKGYSEPKIIARNKVQLTNYVNAFEKSKIDILSQASSGQDISATSIIPLASNLRTFAQDSKNKYMAAMALLKTAQAIRTELHYRLQAVPEDEFKAKINGAKTTYAQALEKAQGDPTLAAAAKFGIGLCEEELRNFEQAKNIYQEITQNPGFEGTAAAAQAHFRLKTMADYQQTVVLAKDPKLPEPEKSIIAPEPQTTMPSIDTIAPNLPAK